MTPSSFQMFPTDLPQVSLPSKLIDFFERLRPKVYKQFLDDESLGDTIETKIVHDGPSHFRIILLSHGTPRVKGHQYVFPGKIFCVGRFYKNPNTENLPESSYVLTREEVQSELDYQV